MFNNALSIFATVLGIVGLSGGAVGYFAKGRGDSIIKYQAIEIQNRDGTIATLKDENTILKAEAAAKDEALKQLQNHNSYLQKLAQGSPQLAKLTKAIENQTKMLSNVLSKKGNT